MTVSRSQSPTPAGTGVYVPLVAFGMSVELAHVASVQRAHWYV